MLWLWKLHLLLKEIGNLSWEKEANKAPLFDQGKFMKHEMKNKEILILQERTEYGYLFSVTCFFTFCFFLLCNRFVNNIFYTYFLFLSKFINFYFGRYKTKNSEKEAKRQDVKNNKRQETGNKRHIVKQALKFFVFFSFLSMK